MSHYNHLTAFERKFIEIRLEDSWSLHHIASELHRNVGTISREVSRCAKGKYCAEQAQENYSENRTHSHKKRILDNDEVRNCVVDLIENKHMSPEEIDARLRLEKYDWTISFTTIYRGIQRDNLRLPLSSRGARGIARKLRHRGKTRHKAGHIETRGKIRISHTISERPQAANNRTRIGDWEADTILGKTGGNVLVTLVDRRSRFLICARAISKRVDNVTPVLISLLNKVPEEQRLTVTPDRGKEFSKHEKVTSETNVEMYFQDPHCPWQRGTNENTNGLLREFFPRNVEIGEFSDEYIISSVDNINNRPKKILGWKTPSEVFFGKTLHLI